VDDVSFSVEAGEVFGLLGPNGAGKTTTISVISTLLRADGGSIHVGGKDVASQSVAVRQALGLVPQETALFPIMSARENLEYFAAIHGVSGRDLKKRVGEALEIAGLQSAADKPRAAYFSGGMRRRLNLAAGLVHRPRLLLLDEPTVGVDTQSRNLILQNIKRLAADEGMAIVYTTHYMEEAEEICARVAIIDHGRLLACDEVSRLVSSASGTTIEVTLAYPNDAFEAALSTAQGVTAVTRQDDRRYAVQAADQERGLAALVSIAAQNGVTFEALRIVRPSLEQVFLELTGRELRDEVGA
jgi:ABC-2 type transport system ATP-binding protein